MANTTPYKILFDACNDLPIWQRSQDLLTALFNQIPLTSGIILEHDATLESTDISCRLDSDDQSFVYFFTQLPNYPKFAHNDYLNRLKPSQHLIDTCWLEFDEKDIVSGAFDFSLFIRCKQPKDTLPTLQSILGEHQINIEWINELLSQSEVQLHFIGAMLSRADTGIRLCLPRYQLGIDPNHLGRPLTNPDNTIVLSLDIGEQIGSRIGVEFPVIDQQKASKQYANLSQQSAPFYADSWTRHSHELIEAIESNRSLTHPQPDKPLLFSRRINHFKQVFTQGTKLPELKTYLYLALASTPCQIDCRV